jgi:hypothetical protein
MILAGSESSYPLRLNVLQGIDLFGVVRGLWQFPCTCFNVLDLRARPALGYPGSLTA